MLHIREIAKLLSIDLETAKKVMAHMSCDFSECMTEEFNRSARYAYETLTRN